jgi:hypothetical protein
MVLQTPYCFWLIISQNLSNFVRMEVLRSAYKKVIKLKELLNDDSSDSPEFNEFLSSTLVCYNAKKFHLPPKNQIDLSHSQVFEFNEAGRSNYSNITKEKLQ